MSEAIKPTPGPCYADGQVVHSDAVTCIAKFGDAYPSRGWAGSDFATPAHQEANAELFADALNVYDETQCTPRQLVERVKELEEVVADYLEAQDALDNNEYLGINAPPFDEVMRHRNAASADLRAALSKSLPNTVAEVKE